MELSMTQEALWTILHSAGISEDSLIAVMLLLQKSEDAMIDLGLWIGQENPTEPEILNKAVEIHNNLPVELQTTTTSQVEEAEEE